MAGKTIAVETLEICAQGAYVAPSGVTVSIAREVAAARAGTVLYRPADIAELPVPGGSTGAMPRIEVTGETTSRAARRLYTDEGVRGVLALNFASARRVGGGFLGGAKAQEEDLCRGSALYPCLETQPAYYDANRAERSSFYTDHAIWSPQVPFFRDDRKVLLDEPYLVSILTMPAPNAAELRTRPDAGPELRATLHSRALMVLQIAAVRGHRQLVLGAWGCGAFRNDPNTPPTRSPRRSTVPGARSIGLSSRCFSAAPMGRTGPCSSSGSADTRLGLAVIDAPYRQIRAAFSDETVTVYQAYSHRIAEPALRAGRFVAPFSLDRMTWIKPSFLWMMYRSGWATKPGQECILAVSITRVGFEWALENSCLSHHDHSVYADQEEWVERQTSQSGADPGGPGTLLALEPLDHRAIQIGLGGDAPRRYAGEWITSLTDATPLARDIRADLDAGDEASARAKLPVEEPYPLTDQLRRRIGAT